MWSMPSSHKVHIWGQLWTFDFPFFTSWILKLHICTTMPGCLFTYLLICLFVHSFCRIWDWTCSLIYARGAISSRVVLTTLSLFVTLTYLVIYARGALPSWVVLTILSLFVTLIYLLRWTLVVIPLPWFQRRWDYQSVPLGLDPLSVRAIVHVHLHWEMSPLPFPF